MLQSFSLHPNKIVSLAALFLLIGVYGVLQEGFAEPSQKDPEKKLAQVQKKIRKSQQTLEKKRGEIGHLEKQLRESEQSIGQLNHQLNTNEKLLKDSQQKINSLQRKEEKLQTKLLQHQQILYAQILSEYQYGGQQKLKLLLNQEEPEKLGRNLVYYDYLHRARLNEIEKATQILQSVKLIQNEIQMEEAKVLQTKENLLKEKQLLVKAQSERKVAMKTLNQSVSSEKEKIARLEENEKQLKNLITQLRSALSDIPAFDHGKGFSKSKGDLYWPVVGTPSNRFGHKRNAKHNKLSWQGIFIPSSEGNNVRSIYHGRIVFAEWMRGLGLLIIVDHGDSYMSLYGHNQSLFKQVGEWVDAGERIAAVGNSGGNSQPGLYFEIRKRGNPINPAKWCSKPASSRKISSN